MAEKFSIHRLVSAELLPRIKSGEHIRLRDFAEDLFDEYSDDFAIVMRESAINQVIIVARKIMSDAVKVRQGSFDFGDLPMALAVPIDGPHEFEFVGIEHAMRKEGRAALTALMQQSARLVDRIKAIEFFIFAAEARGCPDDGVPFDYLNGHRPTDPSHPVQPSPVIG